MKGAIKPGDAVYFKKCKKETRLRAPELEFNGSAVGIFLGVVPSFSKEPTIDDIIQMMGAIGYITFDMISEFIGEDMAKTCIDKYIEKYYKKTEPAEEETESKIVTLKLVDQNGKELAERDT